MAGPTSRQDAADELAQRMGLKPPSSLSRQEEEDDPLDEAIRDTSKAVRLKVLREALDPRPSPPPPPAPAPRTEERTSIDLGSMFGSMSKTLTDLITLTVGNRQPDPVLTEMRLELRDLKQKYEGGQVDPLQTMNQYMALEEQLSERMRKRLDVPPAVTSGDKGADIRYMLELEKMRMEAQDRRMQFDLELEKWRHNAVIGEKHWEEEIALKRAQVAGERASREKNRNIFEDLIGGIKEAVRSKAHGPVGADAEAESEETIRSPRAFKCSGCGETVSGYSAGATEVTCSSCGLVYDLVPAGSEVAQERGAA